MKLGTWGSLGDVLTNTGLWESSLSDHCVIIGFGPFELPTCSLGGEGRGWKRKWDRYNCTTTLLSPAECRGVSAPEATSNSL